LIRLHMGWWAVGPVKPFCCCFRLTFQISITLLAMTPSPSPRPVSSADEGSEAGESSARAADHPKKSSNADNVIPRCELCKQRKVSSRADHIFSHLSDIVTSVSPSHLGTTMSSPWWT
jgi:hypothetical protein